MTEYPICYFYIIYLYIINRGIKLFNQLPYNIKLVENDIKFKLMIKRICRYNVITHRYEYLCT